jgi:hypothetical protein
MERHRLLRSPAQAEALARLETELGNIRQTIRWHLDHEHWEEAAHLGWALWLLW